MALATLEKPQPIQTSFPIPYSRDPSGDFILRYGLEDYGSFCRTNPNQKIRVLGVRGYFPSHIAEHGLSKKYTRRLMREAVTMDPHFLDGVDFRFADVTPKDVEYLERVFKKMKLDGNPDFRAYLMLRTLAICRVVEDFGPEYRKGQIDIDTFDVDNRVRSTLNNTARLLGMRLPKDILVQIDADRTYSSVVFADSLANLLGRPPPSLPEYEGPYWDFYGDLRVKLDIDDLAGRLRASRRVH